MSRIARALVAMAVVTACKSSDLAPAGPTPGQIPGVTKPAPAVELTWSLPSENATMVGAVDTIDLHAVNASELGCTVVGPSQLGLTPGSDPNLVWTVTAAAPGRYPLLATCRGAGGQQASRSDTLSVYPTPEITFGADQVSLMVEDSLDFAYDSINTPGVRVSCRNCGDSTAAPGSGPAHVARIGGNRVRFYNGRRLESDTALRRAVCFSALGLDRRHTRTRCATIFSTLPPMSLPDSIRRAELLPLHRVSLETYDHSGQSVHPDMMRFPEPWAGWECWMVFTPYPGGNGALENPSLAVSHDCQDWHSAPGVRAPLVDRPENGYNSDPELSFDAGRQCLSVIFREVTDRNTIKTMESCDGKTWTAPAVLFALPNHRAISPTVTDGPDGRKQLLYVDAGTTGCGTTSTRIMLRRAGGTTGAGAALDAQGDEEIHLSQPGFVIWHIKWRYIPAKREYWMVYPAYRIDMGTCAVNELFFAKSSNGRDWQSFPLPLLNRLDPRFRFLGLYRATFWYDPDADVLETITSAYEDGQWGEFAFSSAYGPLQRAFTRSLSAPAAALVAHKMPLRRDPPVRRRLIPIEDKIKQ